MKKIMCAANWKMNKGIEETKNFFNEFIDSVSKEDQASFIFFTPALTLMQTSESLKGSAVKWGAQNTHNEDSGAFTGENSPKVVAEMGAHLSLLGHSERRHVFMEPDDLINKKLLALQKWNLPVMLCVGETLEQREAGTTDQIIVEQLNAALKGADLSKELIVAYEPVWAIGTGKVATPEIAEAAHKTLREELNKILGPEKAKLIYILYGGSVKAENAKSLIDQVNIDGFLVGGASLQVGSFKAIYQAAQ
jgi:triosephosphate isomerase